MCLHRPVAHCPVTGGVPGNDLDINLTLNPPQDPPPKVRHIYHGLTDHHQVSSEP